MNRLALLALLLALVAANLYIYTSVFSSASVRVTPLAVGHGDATLVTLERGHAILINTGADASIVRALGQALPPWQHHLDALVLTSANKEEVGGEPFLLEKYHVGTVQKIPHASAGIVLHYDALAITLSSTTPSAVYRIK